MKMQSKMIAAVLLAASTALWAQDRPERPAGERRSSERPAGERPAGDGQRQLRPPRFDPMMEHFFPPELVMRQHEDLGLKEEQQTALKEEMDKIMPQFKEIQEKLQAEMEKLTPLIKAEHVDEAAVLAQSDKITVLENEIKRLRLVSLIKIKNLLTAEQQAKLQEKKKEMYSREAEIRRAVESRRGGEGEGGRGDRPRPPSDGNREGGRRPSPPSE